MIVSLIRQRSALPGHGSSAHSWGLPVAQQQIVPSRPQARPSTDRLYRYIVVYKWSHPTRVGDRDGAGDEPSRPAADPTEAHIRAAPRDWW